MDSGDYAQQLAKWCQQALQRAGHTDCRWDTRARYDPGQGVVVCGCGEFIDAPTVEGQGDPDAPDVAHSPIPYEPRDPIQSTLDLIDPSKVYSPDEVERHILDVLARLECGALFERAAIESAAAANHDWDRAYWRAYHGSSATSEGKRKADAMVSCDDQGLTERRFQADMVREAAKSTMHNLRAVLSGYQSVAKSITAAYGPGGSAGRF